MAGHAGYAAAVSIGQPAMQRLLRTLYAAGKIPHVLSFRQAVPFDGGSVTLSGDLFCDVPQVGFADAPDDRIALALRCWGPLSFSFSDGFFEGSRFEITATLLVPPAVSMIRGLDTDGDGVGDTSALSFGIDGSRVTVSGPVVLAQIKGAPLDPRVQALVDSPLFQALLQLGLRAQLANQAPATIPLDFLGGLNLASVLSATVRVVHGALLIGIDATWGIPVAGLVPVYPAKTVDTTGDRSQLVDFRAGEDLAYTLNPSQVPIYFADALTQITDQIPDDVVIDRMDLVLHDGFLRIEGTAHEVTGGVTVGTADFSFDVVPELTTEPLFTFREALGFRVADVRVDVHLSALARFLEVVGGIVSLGAVALGAEEIVAAIRGSLIRQIGEQGRFIGARNRQITLTGTTKPLIDIRIQTFQFRTDGLVSTIRVRPRLGAPRIAGASRIFGSPSRVQVFYACTLPADLLASDPHLRIAWTLRRLDHNVTVDSADGSAETTRSYRRDLTLDDASGAPSMSLECRVYRTLGTTIENRFHTTVTLKPSDRLDHSHPYVHWGGTVPLPAFVKTADGSLTRNGLASVDRRSKIHRTDLPGRCLFADAYGPVITQHPDYLDALPFPETELSLHRELVCDYCFFGGPDKSSPLV
ncbi:MAG TPA: hypothetical protein VFP34_13710 [Microlunatus sp.]|nr:hypothetical protein [Microlunatus sp.]